MTHRWPQWLPGGSAILYTANSRTGSYDDANLVIESIPDRRRHVVYRGGYYGRYLPSGHLVFVHEGTLFAAPFDLAAREMKGPTVPVVEELRVSPTFGGAQLAFADDGTFVYAPGGTEELDAPIHWLSRDGTVTPLRAEPANWTFLRFSPAGDRLAMRINDGKPDVWVYDWARETLSRLTFDADQALDPVWTPDGRRIVFSSFRSGNGNLYWQRSDGSGEVQRLTESENLQSAGSWHPNGKLLAFAERRSDTASDLMILELDGDEDSGWKPGTPTVFLETPFQETSPKFSPEGVGWRTCPTSRDRPRCTYGRFRARVVSGRSRQEAEATRSGLGPVRDPLRRSRRQDHGRPLHRHGRLFPTWQAGALVRFPDDAPRLPPRSF